MNVCIVGHEYPPNVISGPGRYALNLVEELSRDGHSVTVITPLVRGGKSYERNGSVEIYRLKIRQLGFMEKVLPNLLDTRIMFSLRLRRFFRKFDLSSYDVIHILDVHDSYFLKDEISGKVPVIISVNDYYSFETSWNPLKFAYFSTDIALRYVHYNATKVLNSTYLRKASRIISDTQYTARSIAKNVGIENANISVIYKGVDLEKFTKTVGSDKYESHRILYVGSNMERKGVDDIIRSMPSIMEKFPDARLTIIGRCSVIYKRRLMGIIRKNSISHAIEFIETIPPGKIMKHYEVANVFVMAPVIEDLAQVLMESMATKTPVVCTGVGANPEGIVDDVTGLLVPPHRPDLISEKVCRIFASPKDAERMGSRGRKRVETMFDSGRMARETTGIYSGVLESFKNQ